MDVNNLFQKIQRLIKEHELVRKENDKLKADIAACQKEKQQLETQIVAFETQIAAIQTGGKGMGEKEKEEMNKRINRYIKEIDKAITLLNG
jgi:uncharacterized protein YlxW (UPF0749 family)